MQFPKMLALLVLAALLSACSVATPVAPNSPQVTPVVMVQPESDNSYTWAANAAVSVDTTVYHLTVRVADEIVNHTETKASGSASGYVSSSGYGYASSSYRMWQDGKGILPVQVVAISPDFTGVAVGDYILLKTSDLKAMALPAASQANFICNADTEVLSPNTNGQTLTSDRLTAELDDCRMVTPEYKPGE